MKSGPFLANSLGRNSRYRYAPRSSRPYRTYPRNVADPIPSPTRKPESRCGGRFQECPRLGMASDVLKLRLPNVMRAALYVADTDERGP
jgi:hypothetical protein